MKDNISEGWYKWDTSENEEILAKNGLNIIFGSNLSLWDNLKIYDFENHSLPLLYY